MVSIFQFDVSFWILSVMSCLSLVLSLSLYLKLHVLRKLSKNLSVNVFDKTFNVFDPYPERRKVIHSLVLLPTFLIFLFFFIEFVFLKIFEAGLVLGLAVFLLCFSLMTVDEASETYINANVFIKALRNRADFGKGDLDALFLVNWVMPKLSGYYVLLAVLFSTSSMTLPYIAPPALLYFAQFVGILFESTSSFGISAPYLTLFLFTLLFMIVYFAAERLKCKVFGFPQAVPSACREEQFERLRIMAHWAEAPPFELSHRPVFEDPEIEERKRRALLDKR